MQRLKYLLILLPLIWINHSFAQPIPVGSVQEDQYRLLQLLSDSTIENSFNNRPIWVTTYKKALNNRKVTQYDDSWWANPLLDYETQINKSWKVGLYEPVFTNTINSELPYGGNNGAPWYGRGLTTEFQTGLYATSKYFTATFRPHLTYTQNTDFRTPRFIPRDIQGNPRYAAIFPSIDMPFRFGPDSYSNFNLGQTSIRVHYKNIEAGLSNETLWWGPGIQHALTISNNAPGFKHGFLSTRGPLNLPFNIGDLELKIIWAELTDSEFFESTPRTDRDRFMTGLNLSYSPGFAPNLNLGLVRIIHRYIPEGGLNLEDFGATIPIFNTLQSRNLNQDTQNQLVSAYFRWVFPESNAEVYGEYYREDAYFNLRDLFLEPNHDRGFTIGLQKIVEVQNGFDFIKINGEINSLVPGRLDQVRPQDYYYRHTIIRQGHTNKGQVLGAAIGPGSASQYLGVDGYFDQGSIGLFVQRVVHNDFFHFEFYDVPGRFTETGLNGPKDIFRHRINLNIGINGRYKFGPLLLAGHLVWNKNYNYGRFNYGELQGINFNTVEKNDLVNIQFQLTARYYFTDL